MSDNDFQEPGDPINADLQKALAAAFGDEAIDWNAIAETDDAGIDANGPLLTPGQTSDDAKGGTETPSDPSTALEELLKKVSSAIDDGITPEMLLESNAAPSNQSSDGENESAELGPRHVVFEIGDQQFGLPLTGVLEIDRCGQVTTLPRTPNWLRGVTNLRGQILSVTDFRHLLNLNIDRQAIGEKIIVVNSKKHAATTAVVVDRVLGIRNLVGERGPLSGLSDRVANFSDGISVTDESTTVLIDPDLILGCDELQAFTKQ
jgi:purine-binding chemotaxis protein CheW